MLGTLCVNCVKRMKSTADCVDQAGKRLKLIGLKSPADLSHHDLVSVIETY